jgi:hypothetical protein
MKLIGIREFMDCGMDDPDHGIFHAGNGMFELRCSAGLVEIEPGRTVSQLPDILTILASNGIRRLPLEWDGW